MLTALNESCHVCTDWTRRDCRRYLLDFFVSFLSYFDISMRPWLFCFKLQCFDSMFWYILVFRVVYWALLRTYCLVMKNVTNVILRRTGGIFFQRIVINIARKVLLRRFRCKVFINTHLIFNYSLAS